ncbi:MAG TPA: ABC transporter permease, partial [Pyrinomonadaceae bacterium]|nr:ABC transporter permease [Pyrinomonadaceae bacterium]
RDLRYAIRMLLKTPSFTAVAVLSIAFGIGANTAVFSVVNAVLLKSLPYKDPETLMLVWGSGLSEGIRSRDQVSATDVADFRHQTTAFEDVTTYTGWNPIMSGNGVSAERVPAIQVGDGYFKVMKGTPMLGRVFMAEEQQEGKDFVIVLSYGLWQRRFGSDPAIVGKKVLLNSRPYTIVGVMDPDFRALPSTLVLPEGQFYRPVAEAYDDAKRSERHLRAIARLKPGVTTQQAQTELSMIAQRLEQQHPETNKGRGVHVSSITEDTVGGASRALWMIFGAVGFVLLVACANVANLLLARASARQKEITIRSAIGAARSRLIRQLLTESLLLSIVGGTLGLFIAIWGTGMIERVGARINPVFNGFHIDLRVLAFTFGLTLVTGLLFGIAPALQMSRPNLTESLKDVGRGLGGSVKGNRLRSALVIAEVAMTLVLLVAAGLLVRTIIRLGNVDKGFNSHNVLTMNIGLPSLKYPKPENWIAFYKQATERIAGMPGVSAAGITSVLPLSDNFDGRGLVVEDYPKPRGEEISVDLYVVTPGYLRAMEIPVLKGRAITEQDNVDGMKIALINQTMADQLWPKQDPIGKRIRFPDNDQNPLRWRTIVGVVSDVSQYALDQKPPMQMYLPLEQFPTSFNTIVVKTANKPEEMFGAVRNAILSVDGEQAVYNVATLEQLQSNSILLRSFFMLLLITFAVLALMLAVVGIYGVMSYAVTQRTQEIGIRMALGAGAGDVLKLILRNGLALTAGGVVIGLAGAFVLTRLLAVLLFGVQPTDALTFTTVSLALITAALVACYLPARRAAKVDPLVALRYE